jgi:hypothetical protein
VNEVVDKSLGIGDEFKTVILRLDKGQKIALVTIKGTDIELMQEIYSFVRGNLGLEVDTTNVIH